ncbi:Uncharacterised protein [uncultured archaeon]|nr:Uncharacterised protein [uncultured archaeon]
MRMGMKGQGASEYLVILGAALIVALVAAVLIGYFTGFATDLTEQQSRTYWMGYAAPFQIYDAAYNGAGGQCGAVAGPLPQFELVMKNGDKYPLNLTAIYIASNTTATICSPPGSTATSPIRFAPNEQKVVAVRVSSALCANRTKTSAAVVLRYDSPYISNRSQNGTTKLFVSCS